jgi:hypothetical protein
MKKLILSLTVLSVIGFSSCSDKKTDDPTPGTTTTTTKSKTELLTSAQWQLIAGTIVPPITIDLFGQTITFSDLLEFEGSEPCNKDDIQLFNSDGTITNDEGPTKCDPADPQTTSGGKWAWMENETKLQVIDDGDTTLITVTELTATSMKGNSIMEFPDMNGDPVNHTITFSFRNKK